MNKTDEMTKACTEASVEVLGYEEKKKTRATTHQEMIALSNEHKILRQK